MTDPMNAAPALTVACSLDERALAERSEVLQRQLFARAAETRELADGFAWRFPSSDDLPEQLLAFVRAERRCCSFFQIEVVFESGMGPIWLHLRGPEGVKAFVAGLANGAAEPANAGSA